MQLRGRDWVTSLNICRARRWVHKGPCWWGRTWLCRSPLLDCCGCMSRIDGGVLVFSSLLCVAPATWRRCHRHPENFMIAELVSLSAPQPFSRFSKLCLMTISSTTNAHSDSPSRTYVHRICFRILLYMTLFIHSLPWFCIPLVTTSSIHSLSRFLPSFSLSFSLLFIHTSLSPTWWWGSAWPLDASLAGPWVSRRWSRHSYRRLHRQRVRQSTPADSLRSARGKILPCMTWAPCPALLCQSCRSLPNGHVLAQKYRWQVGVTAPVS